MGFECRTKHNHNLFDMSSLLQKAIRRGDVDKAAYAANEMFEKYENYLWKRLYTVSAEDCYGIITKEIVALKIASDTVNKGSKPDDKNTLFVAKAIILLCLARKNRDADYVACNFMWPDRLLEPSEIPHELDISKCTLDGGVPDYVFDVHTYKGRQNGKTKLDMIKSEQEALEPHQMSLFDNGDWAPFMDMQKKEGQVSARELNEYERFRKGKVTDPTFGGERYGG